MFKSILPIFSFLVIFLISCDKADYRIVETENIETSYDIDVKGIPQFVDVNYIELNHIAQISRFRSGIGHEYSDDFESCRSMKHYFKPNARVAWSTIPIFSPINGTVSRIFEEWAGTQIQIQSEDYPFFIFILFHISLTNPLNAGDTLSAGQQLGVHIGSQTMSDIAVGVSTPEGWKLVSYFEVITDSLFEAYQARGLISRDEIIISKEARDADPLICDVEAFSGTGNIENWIILD